MEYEVLKHIDLYDLEENVTNYLRDGWKCQGGVLYTDDTYFQAMVKED